MLRLGREGDELRVVDDQHGSPTTSIAITEATRAIAEKVQDGELGGTDSWAVLYHMTCAGTTTWRGFPQTIFERGADLLAKESPSWMRLQPRSTRPRHSGRGIRCC